MYVLGGTGGTGVLVCMSCVDQWSEYFCLGGTRGLSMCMSLVEQLISTLGRTNMLMFISFSMSALIFRC